MIAMPMAQIAPTLGSARNGTVRMAADPRRGSGNARTFPRIGVIGCGTIGRQHAEAYRKIGVKLIAVADPDAGALVVAAGASGARPYADYRDMLRTEGLDGVSICTPPSSHRDVALSAFDAGTGVLCEKPLATSSEDCEAMIAASEQASLLLLTGLCHRFQPEIEWLAAMVASGELGTILMFRNRFAFHHATAAITWFSRRAIAGGGVMFDTSVHSVDMFRFLFGEVDQVVAVSASTDTELGPALEVEDSGIIALRAQSGVLGSIEASWRTPPAEATVTLYGTGGAVVYDYDRPGVIAMRRKSEDAWTEIQVETGDRFERQARHFLDCLAGQTEPRVTGRDGARAVEILLAAYRSADGRTMPSALGSGTGARAGTNS
jgi:predicted dehydrogenase